jgi:hypothetical protein
MSLLRNHTGFHFYPLTSGSNDNPTFSQTAPTSFEMKNIPIFIGSLAYYLYGVLLTFTGNVVQAGGAGSAIPYWDIVRALIDALEVRNAWHGTPVSSNHLKGSMLQVTEPLDCGYALPQIIPGIIPAANGTYAIEISVFVPLCIGEGDKPHHTAQLALFYKQAQCVINPSAASVLTGLSTGSSFTSLAVRASAVMLPEPEIRLGPVGEWIDYQSPASSNQSQIALDSFGNVTGLAGTMPNAGVLWQGALTSLRGLPGSFTVDTVTKFSYPFRGQVESMHIQAFVTQQLLAMGGGDFAARAMAAQQAALDGAMGAYPYDQQGSAGGPAGGGNNWKQLTGMLFFPLITAAPDMELTKVQTAKGTQSYFLTGPTFSGTNHTLTKHVRSFDGNKRNDAVKQIVDSGLAKLVLGQDTNLGWVPKLLKKNQTIDPDKLRYLPWRLVRAQPKKVVTLQGATR